MQELWNVGTSFSLDIEHGNYNHETLLTTPALQQEVLPPLHHTHQDVEDGEDGRTDQELVQQQLLDDGLGRGAHEPGVQPLVPVEEYHRKYEGPNHPEPEVLQLQL